MSCINCPSPDSKHPEEYPNTNSLSTNALAWTSSILPEGSALLSCSCCWLPTVLDFVFAGSITAAGIEKLRHVFLAISMVTLAWGIGREGFSRSMIRRVIISVGLLAWAQYKQRAEAETGHHSCH